MGTRLKDKVCIITGAASGIGQRGAELFCEQGAKVVACDVNMEAMRGVADAIAASGGQITVAPVSDLTDPAQCSRLVSFAEETHGGFDVLFNNAARAYFAFMEEITTELWDRTIRDELHIAFYMCHAAWPAMIRRGGGSIVNVGSLAAHRATTAVGNVAHMAAKAGVVAMTKQMAVEGGKHGIRVNSFSPGPTATPQTAWLLDTDEYKKIAGSFLVLGRVGQPIDMANYALFLASDESAWITGTDLLIDGGHATI